MMNILFYGILILVSFLVFLLFFIFLVGILLGAREEYDLSKYAERETGIPWYEIVQLKRRKEKEERDEHRDKKEKERIRKNFK